MSGVSRYQALPPALAAMTVPSESSSMVSTAPGAVRTRGLQVPPNEDRQQRKKQLSSAMESSEAFSIFLLAVGLDHGANERALGLGLNMRTAETTGFARLVRCGAAVVDRMDDKRPLVKPNRQEGDGRERPRTSRFLSGRNGAPQRARLATDTPKR